MNITSSAAAAALILLSASFSNVVVQALTVAVFGGSGFIGRRICSTLVQNGHEVISISRGGRPASYYCSDGTGDWAGKVDWRKYSIRPETRDGETDEEGINIDADTDTDIDTGFDDLGLELPSIDAAISCIGNVNPSKEWDKLTFFGLAFDDELLYKENGLVNECAAKIASRAGAQRFVFMSVSYEVAKMVEGPLDGYMSGKRHAESVISRIFGDDNSIVLGPSLVYGGKRLALFGKVYSKFAESVLLKAYLNGMDAIRNLSSSPMEDWVEKALLSPPVEVRTVARVASAAALGMVTKDMVGPRKQDFYDDRGKPVFYDDVVYVDGTSELKRIDEIIEMKTVETTNDSQLGQVTLHKDGEGKEPLWEGALIGKKPFLYPLPVISVFLALFGFIATQQTVS